MDILWGLRLDPDVGLYRRALVNLLIACTTDIRQHPDKKKFAQECLDLLAQLRRNGLRGDGSDITRIERHASQTLIDIDAEIEEAAARKEAKKQGIAWKDFNWKPRDKTGIDDQSPMKKQQKEAVSGDTETGGIEAGWTIEGMYTDMKKGSLPDNQETE